MLDQRRRQLRLPCRYLLRVSEKMTGGGRQGEEWLPLPLIKMGRFDTHGVTVNDQEAVAPLRLLHMAGAWRDEGPTLQVQPSTAAIHLKLQRPLYR